MNMADFTGEIKRAQDEMRAGSTGRAEAILVMALRQLDKINDGSIAHSDKVSTRIKILNNLGIVRKNRGDYSGSVDAFHDALSSAYREFNHDHRMIVGILTNLGSVYARRKQYANALDCHNRALRISLENPRAVGNKLILKLRNNRAMFFVRFREPAKAREELQAALDLLTELPEAEKPGERLAWLDMSLAMIHAELGDEELVNRSQQHEHYRNARKLFINSSNYYGSIGQPGHRMRQIVNAAEMDLRLRAPKEARKNLLDVREQIDAIDDPALVCDIDNLTIQCAIMSDDHELLLKSVKQAVENIRSLNPERKKVGIARLEGILRMSKKDELLGQLESGTPS